MHMDSDWAPSASIDTLIKRSHFIAQIRQFFTARQVLEVETPLLSQGTITDLHLDPFRSEFPHHSVGKSVDYYLQTSPEFAMKRLLAAGSGAIFQICKAFRNEPCGSNHNPEFSILEWYRPGYDDQQLMTELDELVQHLLGTQPAIRMTYQEACITHLGVDPLRRDLVELRNKAFQLTQENWVNDETDIDTLLNLLFSVFVEPHLGDRVTPCFVHDFPASQSSLAKLNSKNPSVAHRFELYFQGKELANGFYELQDADEQRSRFEQDNQLRSQINRAQRPIDNRFLQALAAGLPDCSGVAVGIDRLFMLAENLPHIKQAISFDFERA